MAFKNVTKLESMNIDEFTNDPAQRIWKGSYTFVCAADIQFGMIGSYSQGKEEPTWEEEIRLSKLAIQQINEMRPKPKFFVICGDILDALPFDEPPKYYSSSKLNDIELRVLQYQDFIKVFRELDPDIKLITVSGNHDLGDVPSKESLRLFREVQFGTDYFHFWVGGVKYVVLNSQLFVAPENVMEDAEKQWKYMNTIKDPSATHIIVFQHIPPFRSDPNEEDTYQIIPKCNRFRLLDLFNDAGVEYVFSGHGHDNSEGKYKNVNVCSTSALGAPLAKDPSGYRVVKVCAKSITHTFIPLEPEETRSKFCGCCWRKNKTIPKNKDVID